MLAPSLHGKPEEEMVRNTAVSRDDYFAYTRATSRPVAVSMKRYFGKLMQTGLGSGAVRRLLENRVRRTQLRPVVSRLSYELCGGIGWERFAPLFAAMEAVTVYVYLHNWIIDGKAGMWDGDSRAVRTRINRTLIAAATTRELIVRAVSEACVSREEREWVHARTSKCLEKTYLGQHLDLKLSTEKLCRFAGFEEYFQTYSRKVRLQSGALYGFSGALGAYLAGERGPRLKAVHDLAESFGMGLHISNDLGDFAPPSDNCTTFAKVYRDQLCDIREGRLTLPLFFALRDGAREDVEFLKSLLHSSSLGEEDSLRASQIIHKTGAYAACRTILRKLHKECRRRLHKTFRRTTVRALYSIMISAIRTNKFLAELRKVQFCSSAQSNPERSAETRNGSGLEREETQGKDVTCAITVSIL